MAAPTFINEQQEEDAADLQFPKDIHTIQGVVEGEICMICGVVLEEPYIRCAECVCITNLCLECFSRGKERDSHENNHKYEVVRADFSLFDSEWTVKEELKLLDCITEHGFGNWVDIAKKFRNKSAEKCKQHYFKCYINAPCDELPTLPNNILPGVAVVTPRPLRLGTEDPPRPYPGTQYYREMAGYSAARGDFEIEYNDQLEADLPLKDMHLCEPGDPDYDIITKLQLGVCDIYQRQLKERQRRKEIIRKHGLIQIRKMFLNLQKFDEATKLDASKLLIPFVQFFSGEKFDMLLEILHYEAELKHKVSLFVNYRNLGIKNFHGIKVYEQLKRRREDQLKERRSFATNMEQIFKHYFGVNPATGVQSVNIPMQLKKTSNPLNILGLPDYEKLSPAEQELCSVVRLVPQSYLEFKELFQRESHLHGGLRLAEARRLIKIDVNKTRKLYDFLIEQQFIIRKV